MTKKTFKDQLNPAMQFITTESAAATVAAPEGYKPNPQYIEKKSKRLQLLIQPSLYEKIKEKARKEGKSVNDTINGILQEATRGE